ncbi:MAG: hypothetical protein V4638_05800 [Bacteroidota bacterium]
MIKIVLKYLLFVNFFVGSFAVFSQDKSEIIQQRIEFISEQFESENIDLTNVIEVLNNRFDNPINLNNCTYDDLQELYILSDIQINDLFLHRKLYGNLISIYELQSLHYWDMAIIQMVLPFVRVDDKLDQLHINFKDLVKEGTFELFARYQRIVESKAAYETAGVSDSILQNTNKYYRGNPDHYYTRFRYSYKTNISFGFTADKDPGEEFFKGANKNGFDFYSIHGFFKGGKYLRAVALGDYVVQIGQGINFWTGYAFGKTADIATVKKTANSLKAYTSVDENRSLRGAATEVGYKDFSLVLFGSMKKMDANVQIDSALIDPEFATSVYLTGLHRTNSEIAQKNQIREVVGGANFKYGNRGLKLGAAAVYQGYDKLINREESPYNLFAYRQKSQLNVSVDYSYVFKNFNFFGEAAMLTNNKAWANLHGVVFSMDAKATFSLVYRNYQRGYFSNYEAGFAEGTRTQNEQGLFAGMKLRFSNAWSMNAYFDMFKFPWMKYQVDAPSHGHEILIQPTYKPNKVLEIYARFREQQRPKNSRNMDDFSVTPIEHVLQRNYRLNVSYAISDAFTIKSRIEYVTVQRKSNEPEQGMILTQDILWKPKNLPMDISLRYALFQTDSYDTRIYSYENNALYTFSIPAYYYSGSRAYALVRYSFARHFDLWVRYGVFIYSNRTELGSGAEEIKGNTKSEITVQLRMKF